MDDMEWAQYAEEIENWSINKGNKQSRGDNKMSKNNDKAMEALLKASGIIDGELKDFQDFGYARLTFVGIEIPANKYDDVIIDMADPLYNRGQIIDIRPSKNGLPDRIKILSVVLLARGVDTEWQYNCQFESNNDEHKLLPQTFITGKELKMKTPVYEIPVIKERYDKGWRFVGNFDFHIAKDRSNRLKINDTLKHVRICEAHDTNGRIIEDKVSIWIMYNHPIHDIVEAQIGFKDIIVK